MHEVRYARQGNEMVLDVLPRGEVAFAAAELFGDARQLLRLAGGQQAARDLAAHHLHAALALAVDAVFEAERAKFIFRDFARQELRGALPKRLNFLADETIVFSFKQLGGIHGFPSDRCHNLPLPVENGLSCDLYL